MSALSKILASVLCASLFVVTSSPCLSGTDVAAEAVPRDDHPARLESATGSHHHAQSKIETGHARHSMPQNGAGHDHHAAADSAPEDPEHSAQLVRPCECGCDRAPAAPGSSMGRVGFALRGAMPAPDSPSEFGALEVFEWELRAGPVLPIDPFPV